MDALFHFPGSLLDGARELGFEQAQVAVGRRGGALDHPERANERARKPQAADRKILHGPLRLGAIQRIGRHPHLTHAVALDAKGFLRHACPQSSRTTEATRRRASSPW